MRFFVLSLFIFLIDFRINSKYIFKSEQFLITPQYNSYTVKKISKDIILSTPENRINSELLIIWGGYHYANKNWMFNQLSDSIKSKFIVICANWNVTLEQIQSKTSSLIREYKISDTSILGFSAGAIQVEMNYNKKFKLIGLIDPSVYSSFIKKNLHNNIIMVYNPSNWGSQSVTLNKLHNKILSSGGFSEKVKLNHSDIPKYFFKTKIL